LVIHTATDIQAPAAWFTNADGAVQPTPGPDFVTGWGLMNAQAAATAVANRRLFEGEISATCYERTFLFNVPAGATGDVRVTLAWDDVAGNPALAIGARQLVNDLDLVLVDPNGQSHFPWQLDQVHRDQFLNPVPDDQQQCGTTYSVQRRFTAIGNPNYVAPNDPANVNDRIPMAGMPRAIRGRDHLNNVEVVDAPAVPGVWRARVMGFNIPQGPQAFSLIGQTFTPFFIPPIKCRFNEWLCGKRAPENLCQRYPWICQDRIVFPPKRGIGVQFSDLRERIPLPLDRICQYVIDCPACAAASRCVAYDLQLATKTRAVVAEIHTGRGNLVMRDDSSDLSKRLQFKAIPGEEYFLVLSPAKGAKPNVPEEIDIRLD
jgi:hypothetical protein